MEPRTKFSYSLRTKRKKGRKLNLPTSMISRSRKQPTWYEIINTLISFVRLFMYLGCYSYCINKKSRKHEWEFQNNHVAFFAGDLSQTNRSVNLASMQRFWGWEAWTQVRGDNQEGRQVKKRKQTKQQQQRKIISLRREWETLLLPESTP